MPKNKKAILILSVLVLSLSLGFFAPYRYARAQDLFAGKIFAFYNVNAADQANCATSVSNFTAWWRSEGGGAKNITELTAESLEGVHFLVLNCPDADQDETHAISNFTMAQAEAVRDWFLDTTTGHHLLWASADSSYTYAGYPDAYRANNASMILEVLGSQLRYEPTSVEDPDYNTGGGAYRPILNTTSDDPVVADCVEGINDVLAHSPTLLYGLQGTTPVALEDTTLTNVYPILMTGAAGIINDPTPLDTMYAHTNGAEGHFVIVAAELGIGGTTHKLIASGGAAIGGYNAMNFEESKGTPLDGPQFVRQTVIWGMEGPVAPPPLPMELILLAAGAVIIIVVVIGLVYFLMRRR
jgi:hypothetical protein